MPWRVVCKRRPYAREQQVRVACRSGLTSRPGPLQRRRCCDARPGTEVRGPGAMMSVSAESLSWGKRERDSARARLPDRNKLRLDTISAQGSNPRNTLGWHGFLAHVKPYAAWHKWRLPGQRLALSSSVHRAPQTEPVERCSNSAFDAQRNRACPLTEMLFARVETNSSHAGSIGLVALRALWWLRSGSMDSRSKTEFRNLAPLLKTGPCCSCVCTARLAVGQ